jgi:hypothetical protein
MPSNRDDKKYQLFIYVDYGLPGETFYLEGMTFVVTSLTHQRLGDMTDEHAQAEGYPNLEMYKDIILKMHVGMTWNTDSLVWVHTFAAKERA